LSDGANVWFWLLWVITLLFGGWGLNFLATGRCCLGSFGSWLVLFVLIGILGLSVYGSPIR
jgi:hypothetical protein